MKRIVFVAIAFCLNLANWVSAQAPLPPALRYDLKRVEETWNILDQIADQIWPGWVGYREVPFLIEYPNGLRLLIGHPSPPDGFEPVTGVTVAGKAVALNRSHVDQTPIDGPFNYGGGIVSFAKAQTVNMKAMLTRYEPDLAQEALPVPLQTASDKTILTYIHELFHVYQGTVYHYRFGNLQYNPTAGYAVYADIEGQALEKAYLTQDQAERRRYLADFLEARASKRNEMTRHEGQCESEDELMEGTATYTEIRTCELLKEGFGSVIGPDEDPLYHHFENADAFIAQKLRYLQENRAQTLEAKNNCYFFGAFQGLLLSRLAPGWQETFFQDQRFLHTDLDSVLALTPAQRQQARQRLDTGYDIQGLRRLHGDYIKARDAAFQRMDARSGKTYVINFKPVREYVTPEYRGETFQVGLMVIAEKGIERLALQDILLEGKETPIIKDQLFYLKWVDTETPAGQKGYTLDYEGKEGEDVYINAIVRCGGFTLKAPKLRVTERPNRIKFSLLAKVTS